jgi:CheY-like chemotaxis protein
LSRPPYHVRRKLEQKQVEIVEGTEFTLRCTNCNTTWTPETEGRQRLPKRYWECPQGCNTKIGKKTKPTTINTLLVDDDEELCRTLAAIMRKMGYTVTTAHNGAQALEATREKKFDAVILDIKLPDTDGVDLLKIIKDRDPIIGTIMLSGAATLQDAVNSLNQGADAFIIKPVDPSEFLHKLGILTGFKRLERELREARAKYTELYSIVDRK